MSLVSGIFGGNRDRDRLRPLYAAIVAAARDEEWYRAGAVPDTLDGRFDMVAAILSLVLLRLEAEGRSTRDDSVLLTETFVEDMDGTVRQIGIGDMLVGKHVGRMMGALGGRLGAFRLAEGEAGYEAAVRRNVFHEAPPSGEAVRFVAARLRRFAGGLAALPAERVLAGELPQP